MPPAAAGEGYGPRVRVLWLAPWFRTLADAWAEPLRSSGEQVLVVTTGRHFEPVTARVPEVLVQGRPRSASGWAEWWRVRREVERFRPDVVVADEARDPRYALWARGVPLVLLIHDAGPHDQQHRRPLRHDVTVRDQARRAVRRVVFSRSVADQVRSRARSPVTVVSLPSEMPDALVPPFVPAEQRRDVVVAGRLGPYKNLPVVLAGWEQHTSSPAYRGDRLLLLGDGEVGRPLPRHAHWQRGRFAFADAAPVVARAKASLAVYRAGSQSGVAVWSMQVGTAPVVSDVGGLPEYLPPGHRPLHPDDVQGLADRLGVLADPTLAARAGAEAGAHYRARCSAQRSAAALTEVLREVVEPTRRPAPGR